MEPLIRYEADGTFRRGLARVLGLRPRRLTFEIELEPDARFSTGASLTSEDVAFSVTDWHAGRLFGDRYDMIAATTIVDDDTLEFELSRPAPELELHLSQAAAAIVPVELRESDP